MRALVWASLVTMPDWDPVKLTAGMPRAFRAMERSAIEMRSPAERSMSSSRRAGLSLTCLARASSSSVVSPMADTTTTTSLPAALAAATRSATFWIFWTSATDEPPYFWTMIGTRETSGAILWGRDNQDDRRARQTAGPRGGDRPCHARACQRAGAASRRARRAGERDEPRQGSGQRPREPARLPGPPAAHHRHLRHRQRLPLGAVGLGHDGM